MCVQRTLVDARARRRVALRIEIDQQHAALHRDQARGEIDAGRRLADAALLVGDRDDLASCARGSHDDEMALAVEPGHGERGRARSRRRRRAAARSPRADRRPSSRRARPSGASSWRAGAGERRAGRRTRARSTISNGCGRRVVLDARRDRLDVGKRELDRRLAQERGLLVIAVEQRRRANPGRAIASGMPGQAAAAADVEHAQAGRVAADAAARRARRAGDA